MNGFQVMPRLSAEEYELLEQDILANGVQVPIVVATDGRIIDGHHRDEIARKHDKHCPRTTASGSESELRSMAFRLNINRRHFTREQKRELIAESLKADPQLSDNEHKKRTGTSWATVHAVRSELEESSQIENFSERVDPRTGNASQPAERPRPVPPIPAPKAEAITAQFSAAVVELNKVLDRFHRIQSSPNFPANKSQVATLHGSDLARSVSELQNLADQLH